MAPSSAPAIPTMADAGTNNTSENPLVENN